MFSAVQRRISSESWRNFSSASSSPKGISLTAIAACAGIAGSVVYLTNPPKAHAFSLGSNSSEEKVENGEPGLLSKIYDTITFKEFREWSDLPATGPGAPPGKLLLD